MATATTEPEPTTVTCPTCGSQQRLAHFAARVIADAIQEATAAYWERRADTLQAALDRPGDHQGHTTPAQRQERRRRLLEAAQACRNRAYVERLDLETP